MEVPKRELSYRYYRKLSSKEQTLLDNSNLTPVRKLLVMFLNKKQNIHIKRAIRLVGKLNTSDIKLSFKYEKQKYAIMEFKFRGFIPLSQYKRFNPKYPHITTNFKIQGEFWIYPKRFASTLEQIHKGYDLIDKVFMEYGVQGYTRILYGKD